ncbi:PEP-CTERM sorting domain-containing protein [Sphingomonas sp. MA1305]|uniref:PEPxxWA-CTERM sorting domain-containing protein n=1 Tax=Sphingomonas sp. MA1305 TaxID=2479204 RepID=UPI001E3A216A|nr:PEPxxWA-CTERM sorting domain-containing protein [Sphingomonas sp. MA1305]MBI0477201.1 PEP-CTERM sorting domain-containing protein [Sphingomonas sp. MA1305]
MTIDIQFGRTKAAFTGMMAAGMLAMINPAEAATLVQYDFTGNAGNEATEAASYAAAHVSGIAFSRSAGLSAPSAGNAFSSASWSVYSAANMTDYLTFGLNVLAGYTASVDQLVFSSRSSNTGPGDLAVLAAVDGGAFQQVATFDQNADAVGNHVLSFAPLVSASNVVFRIVTTSTSAANGGTLAGGGTFRVQNYAGTPSSPFSINGNVAAVSAAVPEPATWAMMILGMGAIGFVMRRRKTVNMTVRFA